MRFQRPSWKLLGFVVSSRGIKANPAKIRALDRLEIPTQLKHVQKLAGCVAALSHFISRLGEKALPLYKLLKQTKTFQWTKEATAALEDDTSILHHVLLLLFIVFLIIITLFGAI